MKGILMRTDMIQAIVDRRKTQTRRLGGLELINDHQPDCWELSPANNVSPPFRFRDKRENIPHNERYFPIECKPRYHAGETVYIKEAYWQEQSGGLWGYKADAIEWPPSNCGGKAVSPLFMPEWAARHFIKILVVRAERLQEIGQTDISREGVELQKMKPNEDWEHHIHVNRMAFMQLWDSINPKYPFESNPWVEVDEFELRR